MNLRSHFFSLLAAILLLAPGTSRSAEVPQLLSYQGRIAVSGQNFTGTGKFKFALVEPIGGNPSTVNTLWNYNGSAAVNGADPGGDGIETTVQGGLYSLLLGDTSVGMAPIEPANTFQSHSDVRLRVWFDDGTHGFQPLSPDKRIGAVGYALSAGVPGGTITTEKLAGRAVTTDKLAVRTLDANQQVTTLEAVGAMNIQPGAVTTEKLADTVRLQVGCIMMHHTFNGAAPVPRGWLTCDGGTINQARYDTEHGPGAFVQDGISTSPLVDRVLPNLDNRYPVGAIATTHAGVSAFPSIGNSGHSVNLAHAHSVPAHKHQWIEGNANGYSLESWNSSGSLIAITHSQPNLGYRISQNTGGEGTTGDYYTSTQSAQSTNSQLLTTQTIQPESIAFKFILKVK